MIYFSLDFFIFLVKKLTLKGGISCITSIGRRTCIFKSLDSEILFIFKKNFTFKF